MQEINSVQRQIKSKGNKVKHNWIIFLFIPYKSPSAILNPTSCSSPLLSPIVLPAGPADRFLQMCCAPIGCLSCFLTGLSHCVSYFHSDAEANAKDYGWTGLSHVRGGCPPVSQLVRKQHSSV